MYTLPLINYQTLKRRLINLISKKSSAPKKEQHVVYDAKTKCAICQELPILPCRISLYCPHLSCYYCIKVCILNCNK